MPINTLLLLITVVFSVCGTSSVSAQTLPEGYGKEKVETFCTSCHSTALISRSSGYPRTAWSKLIAAMVDLSEDLEVRNEILDYLTDNFPPNRNRKSVQAPGSVIINLEEWVVPTPGQRPRDPVEAADGSIWWVGQWADILGRIDPQSGKITEFALPAGSKPHSVEIGPEGGVWYTGNKNATVGKLDPKTEKLTEFEMPDPAARDPHTHVFDTEGILWFSLQHSNMIGRLDPVTGDIRLVTAPTAGSRPYGVKVASDGSIWVACNGSNCLLKLDPETMEITEYKLPSEGTTVRRLDLGPDGTIWWVNSGLGRLGSFDPRTGVVKEWPSPSGSHSHPYAIAYFDGAVWYNESGVRPDMLVRFDPERETFQSWPIPSGEVYAGIVRHMRVSRDGKSLLLHQTATNRISRVWVRN